jgi:hypothetical protein
MIARHLPASQDLPSQLHEYDATRDYLLPDPSFIWGLIFAAQIWHHHVLFRRIRGASDVGVVAELPNSRAEM